MKHLLRALGARGAHSECREKEKKREERKKPLAKTLPGDLFQMHVVQQGPKDIEADTYGTGGRDLGKLALVWSVEAS